MKKLKGVIDRFEGDRAVIKTGNSEVIVPKNELAGFKESDIVSILILNEEEDTTSTKEMAQNLLKEILKED